MNYLVSDELPTAWDHIVVSFTNSVAKDIEYNNGVSLDNIEIGVRHGLLSITYSGGDRITDAFAAFAKEMSANTCSGCGLPSTRSIFKSPKCDDCY